MRQALELGINFFDTANVYSGGVSMQNHYNLLYREEEREMMGLCLSEALASFLGVLSLVADWPVRGRAERPSALKPISLAKSVRENARG